MDTNDLDELNKRLGRIYSLAGSLQSDVNELQLDIRGMKQTQGYCNECRKDHRKEALSTMELIQKVYSDLKQEMEDKKE